MGYRLRPIPDNITFQQVISRTLVDGHLPEVQPLPDVGGLEAILNEDLMPIPPVSDLSDDLSPSLPTQPPPGLRQYVDMVRLSDHEGPRTR